MQQNPLFPSSSNDSSQIPDYLRTSSTTPHAPAPQPERQAAVNIIRQKLENIYADEPSANKEIIKISETTVPLSKHQQFIQTLNASGRSLAEIQTAWHEYYISLPDHEKHEVWQEFYAASQRAATPYQQQLQAQDAAKAQAAEAAREEQAKPRVIPADFTPKEPEPEPKSTAKGKPAERPTVADIKKKIRSTVSSGGKVQKKHHLQSLAFGLASGAIVVIIFLFSFFNEVFIAPFIQPSRQAAATPVIVDPANTPVGTTPEVIIPKINVQIPVDYSQTTTSEASIETALDSGVVHYPTTVMPGQQGNAAFFGHSSNNIFNPGKYKFAFVLLHKLTEGDTFYLTYQGKTYVYEVISHKIVEPTEVGVLGPVPGQTATATLITCDPPGTSLHRLVVVGKQISPDPAGNAAPGTPAVTPQVATTEPTPSLPGNGQTLWSRMWHSIF